MYGYNQVFERFLNETRNKCFKNLQELKFDNKFDDDKLHKQNNNFDCGMFVIMFGYRWDLEQDLLLSQNNMDFFRSKIFCKFWNNTF